jgi:hypothetical protein
MLWRCLDRDVLAVRDGVRPAAVAPTENRASTTTLAAWRLAKKDGRY